MDTINMNELKEILTEDNHFILYHSDLRDELVNKVLPVAVDDYLGYLSNNPDHNPFDPYTALRGQDYLSLFSDDVMIKTMADRDAHEKQREETSRLSATVDRELVREDVEKACASAIEIAVDEHFI